MTTASLNIRVDSTEVAKGERSLDELAKSGANAEKSTTKLTSSTERLSSVARVAAGAFAALGASVSVREIIQASDAWQSAANQLRLVTNSASELSAVQTKLMSVSNDTRSSFESTANLYTRLTRATSEMGLSQSELIGITTTINQSFAVSGATAAEAAAAITQLSQGLAAGALRGDEFNSVAEQAPGIMRAIADSLNMTTGELRAFAAEGGITADIVVNALQGAAESIDQDFSKSVQTFGQSMQVARNNFVEFAGTSDSISAAMAGLSKFVVSASEGFDELGSAVDYTSGMIADFLEIGAEGLTPWISDVYELSVTASEAISQFGSSVASTGATVSTGFDQLDEVVNAFFDNFSTGSVDAAEMFSLAFGTALPNTRAVIETATVAIADAMERMKVRVTMTGAEQEAALSALDSIRNRSINEIIALRDEELAGLYELISAQAEERNAVSSLIDTTKEFNDETYEAWLATQDMAEGVEVLGERVAGTDEEIKAFNKSIEEHLKQQKKNNQAVTETIGALMQEKEALDMTARMQAVFNAVTEASANQALPAEIAQIATLTAELYDAAEAHKIAGDAASESSRVAIAAAESAARKTEENWGRTHEFLTNTLMEFGESGQSVWEGLGDTAVKTIKRIAAELVASKILSFFGGSGGGSGTLASITGSIAGGGGGSGGLSTVASLASLGGSAGVGGFVSGLTGTGAAAASFMGPPTAAAATGASIAAFATNPVTLAVAALAIAAKNDFWKDPDDYKRSYAGLLTAPTPGAAGSTFAVDPFASGFSPVGIAHNASRDEAMKQIEVFRKLDQDYVDLVTKLGGSVNLSAATLAGVGKEGQFGTAGTLLGIGGKTGIEDIVQMVDSYAMQMGLHIEGLDKELLRSVRSAKSAEEAIRLMTEAVEEQDKTLTGKEKEVKAQVQTANYSNASLFSNPTFGGGFDFEKLARVEGLGSDGAPLEGWDERRRRNMEADRLAGIAEPGGMLATPSSIDYVPSGVYGPINSPVKTATIAAETVDNTSNTKMAAEMQQLKLEVKESKVYNRRTFEILDQWAASNFTVTT